jgi:hypothetical protein
MVGLRGEGVWRPGPLHREVGRGEERWGWLLSLPLFLPWTSIHFHLFLCAPMFLAGVQLVATAHGNELENVIKNPALADLVGGIQVRGWKL